MLTKLFGFDPSETTVCKEIVAGITTFLTMSYILVVNPSMFSQLEGMPVGAVFTSTAIAAIIGCLVMAFYGKLPIGMITYVFLNLICGKRTKVTPVMAILAVLFFLKYIFI